MKRTIFAITLICLGISCNSTVAAAEDTDTLELNPNVSTQVEDLRLDQIQTTSEPQEGLQLPQLSERLNYQGLIFESVTIQLNDPDRLPQDQSSQFNLRLAIEEPQPID